MELILAWLRRRERSEHRRRQALLAERERLANAWADHRRLRRSCFID